MELNQTRLSDDTLSKHPALALKHGEGEHLQPVPAARALACDAQPPGGEDKRRQPVRVQQVQMSIAQENPTYLSANVLKKFFKDNPTFKAST